jgi:ParB family transcriptional regulator, chromosome partitioning protein
MQPSARQLIPIRAIAPRPEGRLRKLRPESVKFLTQSIKQIGLQTPISLCATPVVDEYTPYSHNGNTYRVAAGEHRLEACKNLGWTEIPAFIVQLSGTELMLGEIDRLWPA